jgi:hypothetical protein
MASTTPTKEHLKIALTAFIYFIMILTYNFNINNWSNSKKTSLYFTLITLGVMVIFAIINSIQNRNDFKLQQVIFNTSINYLSFLPIFLSIFLFTSKEKYNILVIISYIVLLLVTNVYILKQNTNNMYHFILTYVAVPSILGCVVPFILYKYSKEINLFNNNGYGYICNNDKTKNIINETLICPISE